MLAKYLNGGDITNEGGPFSSCEWVTIIETWATDPNFLKILRKFPLERWWGCEVFIIITPDLWEGMTWRARKWLKDSDNLSD